MLQQVKGEGSFTADMRETINNNFAQLSQVINQRWYVKPDGDNAADGLTPDTALASITRALALADENDQIALLPGEYVESVVIDTPNITIIGIGGRGSAYVAPAVSNATAVLVRASDVTLINVGCEGDGTGFGLHVQGDVSRFRAYGCKCEGGAAAIKIESTAAGSVSDTRLEDVEICWSTDGITIAVSGGGDPVTQLLVKNCLFHNLTNGIVNATVHSVDVWVLGNVFANAEDGTEMTKYIDLAVADTTGLVAGNYFATTVLAAAKLAIAAGVIWAGNQAQAEGAATGGGTAGRPD